MFSRRFRFLALGASLAFGGGVARAGSFTDAYVQASVFHNTSFAGNTSGFGRFGAGYTDVPLQFGWSHTAVRQNGPEVSQAFGGWDLLLGPSIAGWSVKNGTGIWMWN